VKAVVVHEFASFDQIGIDQLPDPIPGDEDVVIDVKAAEVNFPDILVIAGQYQFKPPRPFSPGKAAAGVISAVGRAVTGFTVGDSVAAQVEYGAYAEKLRVKAVNVFRVPPGVSYVKAAGLGLAYQTAHFALVERARMQKGDVVLVLGAAGGIGFASVQLAKALGARTVIGAVSSADKAEIARRAGADATFDLTSDNIRDGLRDFIRKLTGGHGADIVVDPVGGDANAAALRALAWRGRMVIAGFTAGIPVIQSNYLLLKNIEVSGLQWSDYRDRTPEWIAKVQQQLFDLHAAGKIDPLISATFPLADFKSALALLRDRKVQGKVVLDVG